MMDGHERSVIAVTTSEPYTRAAERDSSFVARDSGGLVAFGQEQPSHSRWPSFRGGGRPSARASRHPLVTKNRYKNTDI
jgi:hypothetical protein